jgi:hypothetical protein
MLICVNKITECHGNMWIRNTVTEFSSLIYYIYLRIVASFVTDFFMVESALEIQNFASLHENISKDLYAFKMLYRANKVHSV